MDYEKEYKGALARCKWLLSEGMISKIAATDMFRELIDDNSENVRKEIINIFHSLADGKIPVPINFADIFTWLEKQGRQKNVWSEEDKEHINSLLDRLEGMCKKGSTFITTRFAINEDEDWLKSLKDRVQHKNHWKPSEEQMKALFVLLPTVCNSNPIFSLYEDLKKL